MRDSGTRSHASLYHARFNRDIPQQIHRALFCDQYIILESDCKSFFADINGRFDRHDPARLDWFGGNADIMNIQPEGMADSMHEVFLESRFIRVLALDLGRSEQAKVNEFLF